MSAEHVTKQDLSELRIEMLRELKKISGKAQLPRVTQLLRSSDVQEMLNISSGTLKTLRRNGTINFRKIGGSFYYPYVEIQNLIQPQNNK